MPAMQPEGELQDEHQDARHEEKIRNEDAPATTDFIDQVVLCLNSFVLSSNTRYMFNISLSVSLFFLNVFFLLFLLSSFCSEVCVGGKCAKRLDR